MPTTVNHDTPNMRLRIRRHLETIVDAVLAAEELDDPRWTELAIVFSVSAGGRNFGNSGYAYGSDGKWWAISVPILSVKDAVLRFVSDVRNPIPETLSRALLQYNRETRRASLIAEFDNPDRWSITPSTAHKMIKQLKPNLGQEFEQGE